MPMKNPVTAPWHLDVSHDDVGKLLRGFKPTMMEDRWMFRADEQDAHGNFVVYAHRSWTGDEVLRMSVVLAVSEEVNAAAHTNKHGATITEITWERGEGLFLSTEKEAKELATAVCRGVLGCTL
ncbi:hypothetical protein F66182_973 [Fusarium sp. NRRL 66182]|nr:hypothetical protein F66182_973 [Fusarium sp. NRRL 66182]